MEATPSNSNTDTVHLNIELEELRELQQAYVFCKSIMKLLHSRKLPTDGVDYYLNTNQVMYKRIQENGKSI